METYQQQIFFWHFFHAIEKDLSYERWIDKYKLFIQLLMNGSVPYEEDFRSFRRFCKILYLQDHRDEGRFDALLTSAIEKEREILFGLFQQQIGLLDDTRQNQPNGEETLSNAKNEADKSPGKDPSRGSSSTGDGSNVPPVKDLTNPTTKYFSPVIDETTAGTATKPTSDTVHFLHTDEYFSVTRRQMIQAWQYLRRKEKLGFSAQLDIQQTIKKIAENGLFLEPVLYRGEINRNDTLIIYADFRGSMTPFHEFTDRIIQTARGEGGHPHAPVYYFQNYPLDYVFNNANLSGPVKIKASLLKANRQATLAIIISDAGAARGNPDYSLRVKMTKKFIDYLHESVAHVVWLNPIPKHRWEGTAAAEIAGLVKDKPPLVAVMAPVFDQDGERFQSTIRLLLKYKRNMGQ